MPYAGHYLRGLEVGSVFACGRMRHAWALVACVHRVLLIQWSPAHSRRPQFWRNRAFRSAGNDRILRASYATAVLLPTDAIYFDEIGIRTISKDPSLGDSPVEPRHSRISSGAKHFHLRRCEYRSRKRVDIHICIYKEGSEGNRCKTISIEAEISKVFTNHLGKNDNIYCLRMKIVT